MNLFSKKRNFFKSDIYEQIPIPKPGQLYAVPMDNVLWHAKTAITESKVALPSWYRDLERNQDAGLRHCSGLIDYLRVGYNLPLWGHLDIRPPLAMGSGLWDARFDMTHSEPWKTEGLSMDDTSNWPKYLMESHIAGNQFGENQTGSQCPVATIKKRKKSTYIKLSNPWLFRTAPGWSSLILPQVWDCSANYRVLSGVVHTDFYHHANLVIDVITDSEFSIAEGTRMIHIVPFKREEVLKNSKVLRGDENAWRLLDQLGFGGVFQTSQMDGKYKKEQHKIDQQFSGKDNQ